MAADPMVDIIWGIGMALHGVPVGVDGATNVGIMCWISTFSMSAGWAVGGSGTGMHVSACLVMT